MNPTFPHTTPLRTGPTSVIVAVVTGILLLALGAFVFLGGFVGGTTGYPSEVRLGDVSNNSATQVAGGGSVVVALTSNPSTGYRWVVAGGSSPALVQQGDPIYTAPASNPPVVGAAGTETFRFRATGTGPATLLMVYVRTFEPASAPARTFTATIEIH